MRSRSHRRMVDAGPPKKISSGFQATRTFAFLEWNWRSSSVLKEHTAPPFVKGSALVHHRDMQARPSRWSPHKDSILFEPALEIEHNCPLQTHHGVNHLGLDCRPGSAVQLTETWAGNRPGKGMVL